MPGVPLLGNNFNNLKLRSILKQKNGEKTSCVTGGDKEEKQSVARNNTVGGILILFHGL